VKAARRAAAPSSPQAPGSPLFAPGTPLSDEEAAVIWRELALGHWTVLAATDSNGVRHVAIEPASSKPTVAWGALSATQRRVLVQIAHGLPQKVIAMKLGMAPSSVSSAFQSARVRLGFGTSYELVRACQGAGELIDE
jgi:DNA-binding CsgD family transcriptional regulator